MRISTLLLIAPPGGVWLIDKCHTLVNDGTFNRVKLLKTPW